jgi:hypothetical protein
VPRGFEPVLAVIAKLRIGEIVKITVNALVLAAAALGAASLLAACSSDAGGSSTTDLTVVPPSTHAAPSSAAASKTPQAASIVTPAQLTTPVVTKPATVKLGQPFATPKPGKTTPPVVTPLPTPTGAVTYVSWDYVRPFNCREHADFVDTAPDVSTALNVTVLLRGIPASSVHIVAPNRAVSTLSNASSLVSSTSVGHGVVKATYTTYVSLFHNNFTPVTFSSLTAVANGTNYTVAFPAPATVTLGDCKP